MEIQAIKPLRWLDLEVDQVKKLWTHRKCNAIQQRLVTERLSRETERKREPRRAHQREDINLQMVAGRDESYF